MQKSDSESKGVLWAAYDYVTSFGMQVGIGAFVLVAIYLLWGVFSGGFLEAYARSGADQDRVLEYIRLAGKILTVSGFVMLISAAARYYTEEAAGYLLLILGAGLRWGIPMLLDSSMRMGTIGSELPAYVSSKFSLLGTVSLILAVPVIATDFGYRLGGVRRRARKTPQPTRTRTQEASKTWLCIFCWQTPFCREALRSGCIPYEQMKSCWRLKTGCRCEESSVRNRSPISRAAAQGFDDRLAAKLPEQKKVELTAEEKRQRCRECCIYEEHQKMKYRILSPLVIVASIAMIWIYSGPVKALLGRALEFTDEFAQKISFGGAPPEIVGPDWTSTAAASNVVEWLFLICLGMIMISYLLKGLEYLIFELQV